MCPYGECFTNCIAMIMHPLTVGKPLYISNYNSFLPKRAAQVEDENKEEILLF
jgi:hypothetical protein